MGNISEDREITTLDVYKIVEKIRLETNIPFYVSLRALSVVTDNLSSLLPGSAESSIAQIKNILETPLVMSKDYIRETNDWTKLKGAMIALEEVKNDAQQRSWELHEDLNIITDHLTNIIDILKHADEIISKTFLEENVDFVNTLADYSQMETRWVIKEKLLHVFFEMCSLCKIAISVLLRSNLLLDLSREMQECRDDTYRLMLSTNVFMKILSIGEKMPVIHHDILGKEFVLFILHLIEQSSEDDIITALTKLILVYNLQFDNGFNVVIDVLAESTNPRVFAETVLFLLNRQDDPVNITNESTASNSLLKLMSDIFSSEKTVDIFYENDMKVLFGIVVRHLIDLSPEDKNWILWLKLMHQIITSHSEIIYADHIEDLKLCFNRILEEEYPFKNNEEEIIILINNILP